MLRKASIRRLFQAIHVVVEWKLHHTTCSSRPFAFRIEAAATCNLRCPLCTTTHRTFNPGEARLMTSELFRVILEKIRKPAWRITFYMEGEPMMNPALFEMIELSTHDPHLFTSFSTNLTLMREKLLGPLFRSRIDRISVSLDGFRQASYEQYRVNGRVADVLNGIAMITAWRKRNRLRYPYIEVNMIDFFHIPEEERNELEEFCAAHDVDEFRVRPDQFGMMGAYNPTIAREPPSNCHWPWTSMSIDCDGSVYPCPIAFEQRIPYGSLATSSLQEVWNSDLYVATRTYLSRKEDVHEDLPKLPCYDCRWYGRGPSAREDLVVRKQWLLEVRSESQHKTESAQA